MKGLCLLAVLCVLVVYIAAGGVIFHFIEAGSEQNAQLAVLQARKLFLASHRSVTEDELDTFVLALQAAHSSGILLSGNMTSGSNWDWSGAMFFAGTVVTTIGYGMFSPTTTWGRKFCVAYACVGIPLFLVATTAVADRMKILVHKFCSKGKKINSGKLWNLTLKTVILLLSVSVFLLLPALIFHLTEEDWDYSTSIYYCVITLTTIGFGDYVPGRKLMERSGYRLFVTSWILCGLAWMGTIIAISQDAYNKCFQTNEKKDILNDKAHADMKEKYGEELQYENTQPEGENVLHLLEDDGTISVT